MRKVAARPIPACRSDTARGRSLIAQIVSLGAGIAVGIAVYAAAVAAMRLDEVAQIRRLVGTRFGRAH